MPKPITKAGLLAGASLLGIMLVGTMLYGWPSVRNLDRHFWQISIPVAAAIAYLLTVLITGHSLCYYGAVLLLRLEAAQHALVHTIPMAIKFYREIYPAMMREIHEEVAAPPKLELVRDIEAGTLRQSKITAGTITAKDCL
jgi:hypothetical protein